MELSLVGTTRLYPWRTHLSNILDVFVQAAMLMVSSFAAFFVDDKDSFMLVWVSIGFLGVVSVAILFAGGRGVYQRLSRAAKDFQYFLCHHKAGAGSFARALQLQLAEHPMVKRRVFIDSDDLRDLDLLFEYVGSHCETFVVLCSSEVLLRPYCAGEITTATMRNLPAFCICLPEFSRPSDEFIDKYDAHVPTYGCLSEHGISLDMVQDGLRWIRARPQLFFGAPVSRPSLLALAQQLVAAPSGPVDILGEETPKADVDAETKISILADPRNSEALCSAHILCKMIMPYFSHNALLMPQVLAPQNKLSTMTESLVLVCSNGCFHDPQFVRLLLEAAERKVCWVPVLHEEGFRFPSQEFLDDLLVIGPQLLTAAGRSDTPDTLAFVIESCFKEIAVVFEPQKYSSTMRLLQVKGKEVALRLQHDGAQNKKRTLNLSSSTQGSRSKAKIHHSHNQPPSSSSNDGTDDAASQSLTGVALAFSDERDSRTQARLLADATASDVELGSPNQLPNDDPDFLAHNEVTTTSILQTQLDLARRDNEFLRGLLRATGTSVKAAGSRKIVL